MGQNFAGLCSVVRGDLVPRTRRRDVSATGHFASLVLRSGVMANLEREEGGRCRGCMSNGNCLTK